MCMCACIFVCATCACVCTCTCVCTIYVRIRICVCGCITVCDVCVINEYILAGKFGREFNYVVLRLLTGPKKLLAISYWWTGTTINFPTKFSGCMVYHVLNHT